MKDLELEANRWWRQASADFAFLPKVRELGKYDTCCFLSQQTSEKALKAFLYFQGEELIFTHSIFKLCEIASRSEEEFLALREKVKQLDFYYVEARYPNAIDDVIPAEFYSDRDAEEAIEMTRNVINTVEKYFRKDVQS
jgi:HEPN domain-containing protein